MSHQLLPKEEWTKPDDVGDDKDLEVQEVNNRTGRTLPPDPDHRHRERDGRARGPRVHDCPEEAEERGPERTLECTYG
jgi:hypothetical protein